MSLRARVLNFIDHFAMDLSAAAEGPVLLMVHNCR